MKLLIKIRLKSMFSAAKKSLSGKKKGLGVLMIVALAICLVSVEGLLFGAWNLMAGFLETDFAWLYFALAGLLAFALGIFGTVFTTQNQMYGAKDNELLLAMPIKPGSIVGSRVVALYLLTIAFIAVVMLPAGLVYCLREGWSVSFVIVFLFAMILVGLLTQAVTCLLGWLLHFVLAGFRHKAIVATIFMTVVMVLYFIAINRLEDLLMMLVNNGGKIADALQSFAWPLYALGMGCLGNWSLFAVFALICLAAFGAVTVILNKTFVKAMLVGSGKAKRAVKQRRDTKVRTAGAAICRKECKRFFSSTTYLVNIGMGLFMIVAFVGAGILMREKLAPGLNEIFSEMPRSLLSVFLVGIMGLLASMTPISAPSVSLEGKSIWILRTMPISGAQVLKGKLSFHCIATVPLSVAGVIILGILYGCTAFEIFFAAIGTAVIFLLCGVLGILFNMCSPRLDWENEAGPCKQSMAVFLSIFIMMFISIIYVGMYIGILVILGGEQMSLLAMFILNAFFAVITYLLYLLMVKWGGKRFETL